MIDYKDLSRRQVIRGIRARLRQIDPDEDMLLSERQVRGILDVLSYVFKLETEYRELVWPDLCALLLVMAPKMEWSGYREQEWTRYIEQSITLAHNLEDEPIAAILGIELGTQHERLGNLQKAEKDFLVSLDALSQLNDEPNKALALTKLAHVAYLQENFNETEHWIGKTAGMNEIRTPELAFLHFVQGALALKRSDYEKTLMHFEEVLHLRQTEGVKRHIAVALNDLGASLYLQKKYFEALDYFNQVLDIYQEVESPIQRALTQMNIGCIYMDTNRAIESLLFFQIVEEAFRQSRDKYKLALLYNNWGWACYTLEQLEEARHMYHNAINLWEELGVLWNLVNSMGGLGVVYIQQADREKAVSQFKHCLQKLTGEEERPEYQGLYIQVLDYLRQAEQIEDISKINISQNVTLVVMTYCRSNC